LSSSFAAKQMKISIKNARQPPKRRFYVIYMLIIFVIILTVSN